MADQQYEPFSGKLDAAPEFVPFDGTLDGEKPKPRGAIRAMADLGVGVASGVVGVSKAAANAAGAGNTVSNVLDSADKTVQGWLSPQAQADQQEIAAHMSDAKAKGLNLEGVKAGAKAFATAPGQFAAQAVGSAAPFIASALTGPLLPTALGVAVGMGTSKGAIYDEIKKRGGTEEEAIKAQEYGGPNKDQIALGGALGVADALTGVAGAGGRMLRGALRKPVANAAVDAVQTGAIRRMATGVASEAPLEAVQGGQEQVAANMAAQRAGYEAGTWDNVASNATLEALASAGPGAAFGLADKAPAAVKPPVNTVDVGGSAGQGLAGTEPAPTRVEAMGINPVGGPLQAAAAMAVDSGAHDVEIAKQAAQAAQDAQGEDAKGTAAPSGGAMAGALSTPPDGVGGADSTSVSNVNDGGPGGSNVRFPDINPATGEIISAFDQREADRPKTQPGDIAEFVGQPITNAVMAGRAAASKSKETGDKYAPVQLGTRQFVIRKQENTDAPTSTPTATSAPAQADAQPAEAGRLPEMQPAASGVPVETGAAQPGNDALTESPIDAEIANLKRIEAINIRQNLGLNTKGMASDNLIKSGRLGEVDNDKNPAPATEIKVPERTRYLVTKSPAYDGVEPLSAEDADFELEALENSANKGRLTPAVFAGSEIGKRLDAGTIIGLQTSLKSDPVGTIQALRKHIANKQAANVQNPAPAANQPAQSQESQDAGPNKVGRKDSAQIAQPVHGAGSGAVQAVAPADVAKPATESVAPDKAKWLKAINDQNRMAGDTGVQLKVQDGKLTFWGDPRSTKQGRALEATLDEARRAGASTAEIIASISNPAATVEAKNVDAAAHQAATSPLNDKPEPTDGQKKAGNYPKGHTNIGGLDLAIENPAGSTRSGTDKTGKAWENTLQHHYGYIKGTIGNDKDHVDAFVKPGTPADHTGTVYVVDQIDPDTGMFDEHKVVIGAKNGMEARRIYQTNYAKGWKGMKAITPMPFDEFKTWVKDGPKNKPLATEESSQPATENVAQPQENQREPKAAKTQPQQAKPEAGPAANVQPTAGAGVGSKTEADKPKAESVKAGLSKMQEARERRKNNPEHLGVDSTPLIDGGKPFKTQRAAKEAKKNQPTMRVIRVEGGFALAPKTEAQIAAEARNARRLAVPRFGNPGVPLAAHEFVASRGGLRPNERSDMGIQGNVRVGNRFLFAGTTGMDMDSITEALKEAGYLRDGATHDDARNLIKRSLNNPQYTPEGTEKMAEREIEAQRAAFEAEQEAIAAAQEAEDNELDMAVAAFERAMDEIPKGLAQSDMSMEDALLVAGYTQQEIDDERSQNERAEADQSPAEAAPRESAQSDRGREGAQSQDSPAGSEEGLTSPTRADVLKQQADAEAEAKRKEDGGDKPLPRRELTGDVPDMFNTQGSVFDQPEEAPVETDATLARTRRSSITFSTPYVGKTGAKLVGYEWANKKIEYVDQRGEDRVKRISDWDAADINEVTGRDIVHKFVIVNADGTESLMSAETAAVALGISESSVRSNAKSLLEAEIAKQKKEALAQKNLDDAENGEWFQTPAKAVEGLKEPLRKIWMRRAEWGKAESDYPGRDKLAPFLKGPKGWQAVAVDDLPADGMAEKGLSHVTLMAKEVWDKNGNDATQPEPASETPSTYINGDRAEYTGKTETVAGALFYEVRFTEGRKAGEIGATARAPDGTNPLQTGPVASSGTGIPTPQISGNPEKFIKIAADSVETLRKVDVDRVLTETPRHFKDEVAGYIRSKRKDLAQEVDEVMAEQFQPAPADQATEIQSDAPYEQLLALKSTTLISDTNGRKLYDVVVSPTFRAKHFTTGRGTVPIAPSASYELKLKEQVTGNPSDNGYVLIDKREQNEARKPKPSEQATEILNAANITGKERIDALKDVKSGTITPDELKEAYPAKEEAKPLVAKEPEPSYSGAYETDLFGNPIPTTTGGVAPGRSKSAGVRGDVQPESSVSDTPAPSGDYYVNTLIASETKRELGASLIRTPVHAAQATQYLYKSAVERFDGIVTDKNGKPLAVVGGFKGAISQASVYPGTIMAEAIRIPGAANIWFSHNHPSGKSMLSAADKRLNETMTDVFRGSGIEPMGLLAVAGNDYSYVDANGSISNDPIPAAVARKSVPVMERQLADSSQAREVFSDPASARQAGRALYAKAKEPGIMLMDAQMGLAAWIPITKTMMGPLRGTGGAAAVFRAASQSNASNAIIIHGGELDYAGIGNYQKYTPSENIAAALRKVDVSPLDSINVVTGKSQAEQGRPIADGPMFSRGAQTQATAKVQPIVDAIKAGWKNAPPIVVAFDLQDPRIPERVRQEDLKQRSGGAAGTPEGFFYKGTVYLMSSKVKSANDVARVLAHETLGHYGLRGMFGDALTPILRQIAHMRKDQVRAKAIQYGLKGITDLDRRTAAEEVLAEMAQNTPEIGFVRRAIAAIRTWLRRNVPGFKSIGMTDDEIIRSYILPARRWVERGAKAESSRGMVPAFSRADEPFYSALSTEVAKIPAKAQSGGNWLLNIQGLIKAGKVKADEVEWSGVTDFLKLQDGKVTRDQMVAYLDANGVRVEETVLGGGNKPPGYDADIELLSDNGLTLERNPEDPSMVAFMDENGELLSADELAEEPGLAKELVLAAYRVQEAADADKVPTRYANYQLPGGTNYREVLLTLPTGGPSQVEALSDAELRALILRNDGNADVDDVARADLLAMVGNMDMTSTDIAKLTGKNTAQYKSGHWDQPNVLAHIRLNDRVDADGAKVLFVEEFQSDWAADGRKKGFKPTQVGEFVVRLKEGGAVYRRFGAAQEQEARQIVAQNPELELVDGVRTEPAKVPDAPFVGKTDAWVSLALKRVIKMAVDGGYDKVAFVNGEQSASRYDLSKHVDSIEWTTYDGKGYISLHGLKGVSDQTLEIGVDKKTGIVGPMDIGAPSEWQGKHLSDVVGKDVADKVLGEDKGKLSGDGLKVGGSGMKAFYDKIVPSVAKDVLRKLGGGQMEAIAFPSRSIYDEMGSSLEPKVAGGPLNQPGFTITPKMQDKAEEGLPMFSRQSQTDTPAFKAWFGDSKVVDADGKPLVVYHGTPYDFVSGKSPAAFNTKDFGALLGKGAYFTSDPVDAEQYAGKAAYGGKPNILPVYVSLQNPKVVDSVLAKLPSQSEIVAQGFDGVVLQNNDGSVKWAIAFKPEQIKSAIGNSGDFDPANADIRFSRSVGETLKAITVTDIKARTGNKLADYRGLGLQFLGGRQIVDLYGKDLPQLGRYTQMVQQMSADANEVGAQADGIATGWSKLTDERQLAELMHDATLAQIDPAKEFVTGDNRMQWGKLNADFKALSPEAKTVYTQARDAYEEHYAQVREAIRDKIERSEMSSASKAAMLERMDGEFFDKIKGVYFPLARFGKYVVVTRGPAGVVNVSRAETLNEAEALRTQMRAAYPAADGFTVGKVIKDKEFNASRDSVGRGFLKELFGVLDEKGMGEELQDAVNQLYLASMPDLSWAKHGIHRKGTPGFSQDARRAFAQNMFHGARYLAKLRYADQLQDKLIGMQNYVESQANVEAFDSVKAQQVVDELNKRHDSLMNPKSNPLSTALTSFGFVFHMGLSPASAMVNLSGTAMVAYPIMGAKWGFDKAATALLKAGKEAATHKNDISAALNGDEKRAYDAAVKAGTIDVTAAHDLAGIAQGEDAGVMWKMRPVMKWASFLFHHAERFNRQVTFVAAYRLARETGVRHEVAFEQATKATYDGHFDYASSNRPRVMQGNAAKVLLLFKQYGQNMVYTIARQAQLAMKAETPQERKEARKALGGLLVMHAAGAGVLGLPLVGTLLAAASMLGGSDDEPWDAEVALRNMLADAFGQKPAEVMARGFSRLTPWDISGRVGLDNLILPDIQEGLEGQRLGESAMAAALGPVAGIGINVLKGMQEISEGHMARGLESMMPAALRGPMKALRYEQEGAKDKTGVVIQDEVSLAGIAGQALGFSPSDVRNSTEGRSAIYNADKRLMQRRSELMRQFADAFMAKDQERVASVRQEIQAFNEKNPNRRIGGMQLMQSVRARNKRVDESQDGVYLPKKRRDAIEEGRFAVAD